MILNVLTWRFQPWRLYQCLTTFIRFLIDRIARSIRCDFKKAAPRRSEIDRMKPETLNIFTWIHSHLKDLLPHFQQFIIILRPECYVLTGAPAAPRMAVPGAGLQAHRAA